MTSLVQVVPYHGAASTSSFDGFFLFCAFTLLQILYEGCHPQVVLRNRHAFGFGIVRVYWITE